MVLPASIQAQRDDQFVWGVGGGVTIPSGSARDNHKPAAHGTLMFGIGGVDSPFGVRMDGQYSALGNRGDEGLAVDQGEARVFSLMGHGVCPGITVFLDATVQIFYRELPDPVTGLKGKKSAQLFPVTLGIMF